MEGRFDLCPMDGRKEHASSRWLKEHASSRWFAEQPDSFKISKTIALRKVGGQVIITVEPQIP